MKKLRTNDVDSGGDNDDNDDDDDGVDDDVVYLSHSCLEIYLTSVVWTSYF